VFDTWPKQIAEPIAKEVLNVLTVPRGDFLTVSVVAAAFFASNGIEALRTSLNRAYRVTETRSIIYRRLQSLAFVLIATIGFLAISAAAGAGAADRRHRGAQSRMDRSLYGHHHAVALRHRLRRHRARPVCRASTGCRPAIAVAARTRCRASSSR
jgi:hypothetical protein